jgi:tRNA pseudouridine(55) synthase
LGISEQITPLYSAKKVGGKKMYELARKGLGDTVERPKKIITIHDIKLLSLNGDEVTFEVSCGSGTYIRAIARDLGEKLGCGAYLTALRRTKIGDKNIEDAKTLEELATLFPQSSSIDHDSGKS